MPQAPGFGPSAAAPRSSRDEAAAVKLQQQMRSGKRSGPGLSNGFKIVAAALVFLTALGGAAYKFKPQLYAALGVQPILDLPPEDEPEPPVSAASAPPLPKAAAPSVPAPALVTAPSEVPESAPVPQKLPEPEQPAQEQPLAKATPLLASAPAAPEQPAPLPTTQPVPVMATASDQVIPAAPPKALPVSEEALRPEQVAALRTQPMNLPPPNPVSQASPQLVEIGRTPDAPPMTASPNGTSTVSDLTKGSGPEVRGAPDAVRPAVEGLLKFLSARNWQERMNYTLHPEKMAEKGEGYYQNSADGPIEVDLIEYLRHDTNPQIGKGTHAVFVLSGRSWNYNFPVMVEQTEEGARVDWLTFIEFKDDLLRHYLSSDLDNVWSFHVELRRTHYFEDNVPGSDKMDCFEIMSVMGTAHAFAFVPKDSALARSLANTITWDKDVSYVVANLQFRNHAGGKWLELVGLPQLNWYTAPDDGTVGEQQSAQADSAPPPPVAKPAPKAATKRTAKSKK
jgi:hypothetical protein